MWRFHKITLKLVQILLQCYFLKMNTHWCTYLKKSRVIRIASLWQFLGNVSLYLFFNAFCNYIANAGKKNRKNCNMGLKKVNIVTKSLSSYTASMHRSPTLCHPQCVFLHQTLHQFLLQMLVYWHWLSRNLNLQVPSSGINGPCLW